ncbi:MAG: DEAD/DEAH box helicase [Patescibacteria group bacterium]
MRFYETRGGFSSSYFILEQNTSLPVAGFSGLSIAPLFLEALTRINYSVPTPIQQQVIPIAVEGKDIVGIAQTGTGKTLAFCLPMLQRLSNMDAQGLVLVPTRELASQVEESIQQLSAGMGVRTAVLIGGAPMYPQVRALRNHPHVIVATPGRFMDHLKQKNFNLTRVRVVVLDEADRMLDMGFAHQITTILKMISTERQTMLFSATMPAEIMKLATGHMQLPIRIEIAPAGTTASRVTQEIFIVQRDAKIPMVEKLLAKYSGTTLIFSKTKHGARKLTDMIRGMGHTVAELHANRSLVQRREALAGFKSGAYRVLVATDIASRGIDVTGIELVINFDLPMNPEDYVHRIGRTARAGAGGHAISLATPDQRITLRNIERIIRMEIPTSEGPGMPQMDRQSSQGSRPFAGRRRTFGARRGFRPRRRSF